MTATDTWQQIHVERAAMADTLAGLDDGQWSAPSWCGDWPVRMTAAHILLAAEQTVGRFYRQLAAAGFRFNTYAERAGRPLSDLATHEIVDRLRARTTTTNRPPAPVVAMLTEVVVHGGDIRMPLGLEHRPDDATLEVVASYCLSTNLLIGSKRRAAGLRLAATDCGWSRGDGHEVSGPLLSIVMAITGRHQACDHLTGEGVETLRGR